MIQIRSLDWFRKLANNRKDTCRGESDTLIFALRGIYLSLLNCNSQILLNCTEVQ